MSKSQIDTEKQNFQVAWQDILHYLKNNQKLSGVAEIPDWLQKVIEYNTKGNYQMRGLTTVFTYKILEKPENITKEKMKLVRIMGWLIEVTQAYFIITDDIVDGSITRRGQDCWYRKPEVGLGALNDATMLQCTLYDMLKFFFGETKYYPSIFEMFNEYILYTGIGQHLDEKTNRQKGNNYSLYNIDRYDIIVKYKATLFCFEMPILAAMHVVDNEIKLPKNELRNIIFEITKLYQAQNDMLDCFGDETMTGKKGTDIQEGKCTWLAVQALQRCNPEQRAVFEKYYGSRETEHVNRIKLLYDDLHIQECYKEYSTEKYKAILNQMNTLQIDQSIFNQYFDLYKKKAAMMVLCQA